MLNWVIVLLDDIHFPTLTVNQTMKFALRNKVPRDREEHLKKKHHYVQEAKNSILDTLGIGHAKKTKVGNEFIRGVSGGERKRVSLAEMMAGQVRPIKWTLILANIHHRAQCNSGINQLGV